MPRPVLAQPLACAALLLLITAALGADQPPAARFDRDVLPVLSDHCFQCHGPDAKVRKR